MTVAQNSHTFLCAGYVLIKFYISSCKVISYDVCKTLPYLMAVSKDTQSQKWYLICPIKNESFQDFCASHKMSLLLLNPVISVGLQHIIFPVKTISSGLYNRVFDPNNIYFYLFQFILSMSHLQSLEPMLITHKNAIR